MPGVAEAMGGRKGFHRLCLPLLCWPLAAVRAFLAGGCKVQLMPCKALNGLNPCCVRARLPPDDICSAAAVSPGRARAVPRDVIGVEWGLLHGAACDAASKEALQCLQKPSPKSLSPLLYPGSLIPSKTPLMSLSPRTGYSPLRIGTVNNSSPA